MADAELEKLLESEVLIHHFRLSVRDPRMERFLAPDFSETGLAFDALKNHNSVDRDIPFYQLWAEPAELSGFSATWS